MPTWTVEFFPFNALEFGTVTENGGADSGFPLSRLYDRAISLFYKDTYTGEKWFALNQAVSQYGIDFLAIEHHNLNGVNLSWQWSDGGFGVDQTDAVTPWTQSGDAQIIKRSSGLLVKQYWRVYSSAMTNPQIGEIYMSRGFSFNCLRESNPYGNDVDQVQWNQSLGGVERATKLGPKKRIRNYVFMLSPSEWSDFESVVDYLDDYSKPFYFKDHADNYYLARFGELPQIDFSHNTHTRVSVQVKEML